MYMTDRSVKERAFKRRATARLENSLPISQLCVNGDGVRNRRARRSLRAGCRGVMRVRQPDDRDEKDAEHDGSQDETTECGEPAGFGRLRLRHENPRKSVRRL